jgi:TolA-binding protein
MIKSKTNEVQQLKVQNKEMEGQVVELRKSVNGLSLEIAGLKAKQAHLESSLQASSVKGSSPSNVAQDTKMQVRNISTPALNLKEAKNPASNKPTSDKT